jgi:mannosylglycerate hydrolase
MSKLTFHLIPHTHWDREWYLPRGQFGARLILVIDDLIDRLEGEPTIPGFLLDGQTVLLEDYLQVRPEQRQRVSRLIAQGRIETGPWYVLADEQIPSGESLLRNLMLGRTDTRSLGQGMQVMYSPDTFGHPAILPSIAAEFGLEYGAAWRGIRSERDLFRWKGPDGREILMYHFPPDGYEIGSTLSSDPDLALGAWEPVRRKLLSRSASSHIAVFVGADHHAARADLSNLRNAIARLEPGNEVRLSRLGDFLAGVQGTEGLLTVSGEQRHHGYTWTLQGVHGTRSHQKRRNSRIELWLERYAEPLAALSRRVKGRDRRPRLTWAWRTLVQSHFHDAIGGCASDAVALELDGRQTEVEGIARELVRESLQDLAGWDPDRARDRPEEVSPSLLIWNPAPRTREGIVLAQVTRFRRDVLVGPPGNRVPRVNNESGHFAFRTLTGEVIPVQVLGVEPALERLDAIHHYPDQDEVELIRVAFEAPPVGGLSSQVLSLASGDKIPAWGGAEAAGRRIANEQVEIEVARDGSLSVLDRSTGERREDLLRFESETDLGDCYTFNPARPPRIRQSKGPARVRVLASGPMVAALEIAAQVGVLLIVLFRDNPFIRCTLRFDNQAVDCRLRARLLSGIAGVPAVAGAQFGTEVRRRVIDRPHVNETPVATAPAHRFVGIPGSPGLALFAPGFFEYELEHEGALLFTILRAVGQLSRGNLSTRPGHAGWPTPTPLAQCPGADTVDFALALGNGDWGDPAMLHRSWEDLFLPLKGRWIRDWNGREEPIEGIELEGEGLALSSVMPAQHGEGLVIRCFNLSAGPSHGRLIFAFPIKRIRRIRADETVVGELTPENQHQVQFTAQPREIVSFLVLS